MTRLLPSLAFIVLAACGTTTRFTPTNPSPRPMQERDPGSVHVYTTGHPEIPYIEVGVIQSRQSSELSSHEMPEIIQEMRKKAARIGCDGVIINGANNTVVGHQNVDGSGSTSTLEGYWGACIMYEQPRERSAEVAPAS
jgi:hypothetical protein